MTVPKLSLQRLRQALAHFPRAKVLVVGDLILDEFIWGKVSRISPEAPVPVVEVGSQSAMPGGAANVAHNIHALGGQVFVAGVIGRDHAGERLLAALVEREMHVEGVLVDPARPTTIKTRVIAHHQQVVRVDRETQAPLSRRFSGALLDAVRAQVPLVDAVIIEDYGKGVVTRQLLQHVVPLARRHQAAILVDPKEEHLDLYRGVTAITPNRSEAGHAVGRVLKDDAAVDAAAKELLRRLRCDAVLVTLGEDGMLLLERGGRRTRVPTVAQEVFDVAGAGDTVIATFALALAAGLPMPEAAMLANYAAGIVVGKVGTAVATPTELLARVNGTLRLARPARAPRRHSALSTRR